MRFTLVIGLIIFQLPALAATLPNPKERIDYWRSNYTELTEQNDNRVALAKVVFDQVLQAAGTRHGVHPRLHIVKENPLNISLPISIPDGWIIISKSVLDICYQQKRYAQDKLAFILAHEIAHLLDDDFWHMNFFNAVDSSIKKGRTDPAILSDLISIVGSADKIAAKELRADEHGILFTSMAGFNVNAIIGKDLDHSFFQQWEALLDVKRVSKPSADPTKNQNVHPTTKQRTAAVLARLQQISEQSELFRLGLLFYQTGKFDLAVRAFNEFLRHYPGREVHHNLATSYHQLALNHYRDGSLIDSKTEFKYNIAVDPYTRASQYVLRGDKQHKALFDENIANAINYYQAAIKQDPGYLLSYQNLGSAYIVNGKPFKAIALLKDAIDINPQNATSLNLLGVAFYYAENPNKAIKYMQQARRINSRYIDPLYNLGMVAHLEDRADDAKFYWEEYVARDQHSHWANNIRKTYGIGEELRKRRGLPTLRREKIMDLQVGNYTEEVPKKWGVPNTHLYPLQETPHESAIYQNGITTIAEGDEIRMMVAGRNYTGKSVRGISIGSKAPDIIKAYGRPPIQLSTTQGNSLVYNKDGITFQLRNNEVVSWVIY